MERIACCVELTEHEARNTVRHTSASHYSQLFTYPLEDCQSLI
jgi:hypothetical protein